MRVAFVSQPWATPIPPSESIAIWINEVAHRLAASPEVSAVRVYAVGGNDPPRPAAHDGVEYRYVRQTHPWLRAKARELAGRLRRSRRPFFASRLYHRGYPVAVGRDLCTSPCDVVHIMNFSQFVPVIAAKAPGASIVLNMRCEWLSDLDPRWIRSRLRRTDLVLGCSEHVTRLAAAAFPEHAGQFATVYNGVDTEAFRPAERPASKRVVFVSRVSPEKGVHVLFEAFDRVLDRHPDAELELVGAEAHVPRDMLAGVSRDSAVRALAPFYAHGYLNGLRTRFPRVTERLRQCGSVDHAEVAARLRHADLFVAPSLSEAFGNAVVEAMASGLPVVATRVGGHVETVADGRTGLLVPPGEAVALADAIDGLLEDVAARRAMGAEARRRAVSLFSWDAVVDCLMGHYRQLVATA